MEIKVISIKKTDNLELSNVVTSIKYEISKTTDGITEKIEGEANLDVSELNVERFTPFTSLTENLVKDWVLLCIGERITSIESYLDDLINQQINMISGFTQSNIDLPWI